MKHLIIVLIFLISTGLIKAQTPKTVKIGNQVWMSENLGTSSGTKPNPSQATNYNQTTSNSSQTQTTSNSSQTQTSEKPKVVNCNYKFTKPKLNIEYIYNRVECCKCTEYAMCSVKPNLVTIEESAYIREMLKLHFEGVNADEAHREADEIRLQNFIQTNYSNGALDPGVSPYLSSLYSGFMDDIFTSFFNAERPKNYGSLNRKVEKYYNSKSCKNHQGYCK
jgi:hypothetical protein